MNLLDILSPNAVKVPLAATDKQAAINELTRRGFRPRDLRLAERLAIG